MPKNTGNDEDKRLALTAISNMGAVLVTVATATLALSATFPGDLYSGQSRSFLWTGWILLLASLLMGLLALGQQINLLSESKLRPRGGLLEYFSLLQLLSVLVGLVFLASFAFGNVTAKVPERRKRPIIISETMYCPASSDEKRRKTGTGNVVLVSGPAQRAEALREQIADVLAPLGLRLSAEKTRVVHIDDGFDFLGHHIRRQRKRGTNKRYVYTRPSKKAVQAIKDQVSERTYRNTQNQSLTQLLTGLNRTLRGWAYYFHHGSAKRTFNTVDHHTWQAVEEIL
ncbi:group II intron maturase-specific domain-containing protein [Streptomyces sp. DSM 40750]|uniref:group II intron maturase-specific domain-containing protein n=1 Tax=Streptomyces sp. DSM 40750 TaxID=2801030 RepID=UPI00214ABE38|nr:group II intron maturase-specific domain-containing protein [Streptomyces sp. DSM 40750]UUU24622.1 hypothetical protein JIX55_32650 [Streptomyces sp. DSM 40750]